MTIRVQGVEEVQRALLKLTPSLQRKYLRQAVNAGARVVVKAARSNLRSNGSNRRRRDEQGRFQGLSRSFKVFPSGKWRDAAERRRRGEIGARVGFGKGGRHGHLVEFGHRQVTAKGVQVGFVAPKPFMQPARDASLGAVRRAVEQKLAAGIKKET